jgi:hypothetical protein
LVLAHKTNKLSYKPTNTHMIFVKKIYSPVKWHQKRSAKLADAKKL